MTQTTFFQPITVLLITFSGHYCSKMINIQDFVTDLDLHLSEAEE